MNEINVNLIDCISEITSRHICMDGENYLYLDDFSCVSDSVVSEANKLKEAKELNVKLQNKVKEAMAFLDKTDNREFPSYIPKDGEILAETIAKRVEARQFIRENR